MSVSTVKLPSSFRDPNGFVFKHQGKVYRQINKCYAAEYEQFVESGFYQYLVNKQYLVSHSEVELDNEVLDSLVDEQLRYKIIEPQQVPFISYPYEWSFSQLKDAAMLTLQVHLLALKKGFSLKDASAYNVQFINSQAIFIDTLSFEPYVEGQPWVAYRQFCQHFLAPLALMAFRDVKLGGLLTTNIDGVPLELASKLLPIRTRVNYSMLAHIHTHARMQRHYADSALAVANAKTKRSQLSLSAHIALVESLASAVNKLRWKLPDTEWGKYYENTNYTDEAAQTKRTIVDEFFQCILREFDNEKLDIVQDLGANRGEFSRVAAKYAKLVVSQDIDPVAVEQNYLSTKCESDKNLLPLIQDLFTPSPAIGWSNVERSSFLQRGNCDVVMALALVHHLAISNNVPLDDIFELFSKLSKWLIIEFVPKSDSQVVRLLATRKDIFPNYTQEGFERVIAKKYNIEKKGRVSGSERMLYLLRAL